MPVVRRFWQLSGDAQGDDAWRGPQDDQPTHGDQPQDSLLKAGLATAGIGCERAVGTVRYALPGIRNEDSRTVHDDVRAVRLRSLKGYCGHRSEPLWTCVSQPAAVSFLARMASQRPVNLFGRTLTAESPSRIRIWRGLWITACQFWKRSARPHGPLRQGK